MGVAVTRCWMCVYYGSGYVIRSLGLTRQAHQLLAPRVICGGIDLKWHWVQFTRHYIFIHCLSERRRREYLCRRTIAVESRGWRRHFFVNIFEKSKNRKIEKSKNRKKSKKKKKKSIFFRFQEISIKTSFEGMSVFRSKGNQKSFLVFVVEFFFRRVFLLVGWLVRWDFEILRSNIEM